MGRKSKRSKATRSQQSSSAGNSSSSRTRSTADAIAAGVDACTNILRLQLISTRTDGLCQADAVVADLLRRGVTQFADACALRAAIADAFLADVERFRPFLPDKYRTRRGPANYAHEIKDGFKWSDHIELVITRELISFPIHVYRFRAQTVTQIDGGPNDMVTSDFPTDPVVYEGDERTRPICLGYYDDLHYVGLEEEGRSHLIPKPRSGSSSGSGISTTTTVDAAAARTARTTRSKAKKEQPPANAATAARTARTTRSKSGQSGGNGADAEAEDGGGEKEQPRRSGRRRAKAEREAAGECNGGGSCGKANCGGCDQPKQKKSKSSSKASDSSAMEVDDMDGQRFEDAVEDEVFEDAMEKEETEEMPVRNKLS